MSKGNRYLLTYSLLSAFQWAEGDEAHYKEFLDTLENKRKPQSQDMLNGIKFENMVEAACQGDFPPADHPWRRGIIKTANIVRGGAYQTALSRDLVVDGFPFLVYGKLDFLKNGIVYDTKFIRYENSYRFGRYQQSPQHSVYLFLCPEASAFVYLTSAGWYVFRDRYEPWQCDPMERIAGRFLDYLRRYNLLELYENNWKAKY